MNSKDKIISAIEKVPSAKAQNREHHRFTNKTVGRFFAAFLMMAGAACLLLTQQVYRTLPYILGCIMTIMGLSNVVLGLWANEFRSKETKLTANGIVYFVLGTVILYHHANADAIIGNIWGVLGLIKGSEAINAALYNLAHKNPFVGKGIQAVVEVLLGIMLLLDPATSVQHHVFILGLELMIVGWQIFRESK